MTGVSVMGDTVRRVLITGTTGLVGYHIYEQFRDVKKYQVTGTSRSPGKYVDVQVDLTDPDCVKELRKNAPADVVIHTAALSKTDVCQAEKERCYKANVESTQNLLSAFPHAKFIYFSTYAVYNTPEGKCKESSPVNATNFYIETKLSGEQLVSVRPSSVIFRPSVIFGYTAFERESKNYFMQLLDNIRAKKVTRSPVDQFFNPVHVEIVARIVQLAVDKDISGTFNIGSNEDISKYEFNRRVMKKLGFIETYLEGIDSKALAVIRPNNGTVSSSHIQRTLDYRIPHLDEMIEILYRSTEGHTLL
jgi:dTDP-4-dehydrorhamnose reductase